MEYTDLNRGKVQHAERFHQSVLFDGIRYDNITPTDIDGFFEIHGECFVYYEFKLKGKDIPRGQKLALERQVDAMRKVGKNAVLFLCVHNVEDARQDVFAKDAIVDKFYFNGIWHKDGKRTAKQCTDAFVRKYFPEMRM